MTSFINILAQVEAVPEAAQASHGVTEIVVVGFCFVLGVLAVFTTLTSVIGSIFARSAANAAKKAQQAAEANAAAAQAAAPAPVPAAAAEEDETVLFAVIAAAVHSVYGDRAHRVVSIHSAGPGWAQEGRRQIFSSHRVR
ncbi:OadG family transporter subunit [Coraliomargarita parva]|uniref:OadG family transporter subunit n=1 Tax=Coraliomargarita parva TaxID=3014050 RepID=UPI0022B55C73|nr:OadG family transporter subunit [Coraliomargarita parva]